MEKRELGESDVCAECGEDRTLVNGRRSLQLGERLFFATVERSRDCWEGVDEVGVLGCGTGAGGGGYVCQRHVFECYGGAFTGTGSGVVLVV